MKHKVLVIDDEAEIRKTIGLQLEGTDFEVCEAENGEEGIKALNGENVLEMDVIVCDVRMPKINGFEAVDYFRREYPSIPVIVLTRYPDAELSIDFMKKGAVDYLVKPVEKDELLAAVSKAAAGRSLFSGAEAKM